MKTESLKDKPARTRIQKAMIYAMAHPVRPVQSETGDSPYRDLGNALWQCRIVLRHSRALAERVLDGAITLGEAFREAQPLVGSKPGLPVLNSLRAPADDINRSDLNEFQQIFGWGNACLMTIEKPKPEPEHRQPSVVPDEPDDRNSEIPNTSIPKPHELPGHIQPPMYFGD